VLGLGPPPVGALEGDEGRELDGAPLAKADLARRALAVAVDRLLLPVDRLGRGDRRRRGDGQHHQRSEHPFPKVRRTDLEMMMSTEAKVLLLSAAT